MKNKYQKTLFSIILPIYHSNKYYLKQTIKSIVYQGEILKKGELIVVDRGNKSQIYQYISNNLSKYIKVNYYKNNQAITAKGLNIGIKHAQGKYIIRVDDHCILPKNYVEKIIETLKTKKYDNVGVQQVIIGKGYWGKAIAIVMNSVFGNGGVVYRKSISKERLTDTVFLGAWKKSLFEKIGYFDEKFVTNQDAEFILHILKNRITRSVSEDIELNARIIKKFGKIVIIPGLTIKNYCRNSIISFAVQFFRYGIGRNYTFHKHKQYQKRHKIIFLVLIFFPISFALYIPFTIIYSFIITFPKKIKYYPALLVLYPVQHISWLSGLFYKEFADKSALEKTEKNAQN